MNKKQLKIKQKWFYPIQARVEQFMEETYKFHSCNWQVVSRTHVFENYIVTDKEGAYRIVLIVMTNPTRRSAFASDFSVYHPEH